MTLVNQFKWKYCLLLATDKIGSRNFLLACNCENAQAYDHVFGSQVFFFIGLRGSQFFSTLQNKLCAVVQEREGERES